MTEQKIDADRMNNQELIKFLRNMQGEMISEAELYCAEPWYGSGNMVFTEPEDYAIEEAIKALEKQVPKKMKHLTECVNEGYYCSTCSKRLFKKKIIKKHKCCPNCGQRIDYSECYEY